MHLGRGIRYLPLGIIFFFLASLGLSANKTNAEEYEGNYEAKYLADRDGAMHNDRYDYKYNMNKNYDRNFNRDDRYDRDRYNKNYRDDRYDRDRYNKNYRDDRYDRDRYNKNYRDGRYDRDKNYNRNDRKNYDDRYDRDRYNKNYRDDRYDRDRYNKNYRDDKCKNNSKCKSKYYPTNSYGSYKYILSGGGGIGNYNYPSKQNYDRNYKIKNKTYKPSYQHEGYKNKRIYSRDHEMENKYYQREKCNTSYYLDQDCNKFFKMEKFKEKYEGNCHPRSYSQDNFYDMTNNCCDNFGYQDCDCDDCYLIFNDDNANYNNYQYVDWDSEDYI